MPTPRARGLLTTGAVLGLAVSLTVAGCSSAPVPTSQPSSSPSSEGGGVGQGRAPDDAGVEGPRLVAGGVSVLQPEGWQGGRTDAASQEATLASMDRPVADVLRTLLDGFGSEVPAAVLLDLEGIQSGQTTDLATFTVLELPAGPVGEIQDGLVDVFTRKGATSLTTGEPDLPVGRVRSISFDAEESGVASHTDGYLVPVDGRTTYVQLGWARGRDTADLEAMVASLRLV